MLDFNSYSWQAINTIIPHNKLEFMSTEKKKPFKRDHALNDATSGQFGEEPSDIPEEHSEMQKNEDERKKLPEDFQKIFKDYSNIMSVV